MIKAALTLTIAASIAISLPTSARFAEKLAEYDATVAGIAIVETAQTKDPDAAQLEHTRLSLVEHCENLSALYNVGAAAAPDELSRAGLPSAVSAAACQ